MEFDKDLAARQEARTLCAAAENARKLLAGFSQEKLDAIQEAFEDIGMEHSAVIMNVLSKEWVEAEGDDRIPAYGDQKEIRQAP